MERSLRYARFRLANAGLWPESRLARVAVYFLASDLLLFVVEKVAALFKLSFGQGMGGWIVFLSFISGILYSILAYRWLKSRILWRLRNRLIVTYMFIGVIPSVLLLAMGGFTIYLFSGQFANFVVTSELNAQLRRMESSNAAITNELAARIQSGRAPTADSLEGLRLRNPSWKHRKLCAWLGDKPLAFCGSTPPFALPSFLPETFQQIVRDENQLYLRTSTSVPVGKETLTVISSEAFDQDLAEKIAADLGEITLYTPGFRSPPEPASPASAPVSSAPATSAPASGSNLAITLDDRDAPARPNGEKPTLKPTFTAGQLAPATGMFDREITFGTPLPVVDWTNGTQHATSALLRVQTRPSVLYARLFAALGDFAKGVEYFLLAIAIVFAIIELLALIIGTRLTRTITGAVAQLYDATRHINAGDFRHRIPVKSSDQLATLATSFNSMTASLEQLVEEQKQKQRMESELVIAQEVQAQLYPKQISQLQSLEVHGFCRPARTVSGDYYDFLSLVSNKLILAVGDISGKGISAALLMSTIHSAVRAYSMEGIPVLRESTVGAGAGAGLMLASSPGVELSPSAMLSLLNHQLYDSTPTEKYATLFLSVYDGNSRILTYSNGGHLPPILICEDGSTRKLECGGTVVGLFDNMEYMEDSVQLQSGEIFLAYSDGVTEPENDFGEFGEERLLNLVRENRHLPLARISEIVTAAVDDWIGSNEQPDDVTLVLARAR